jgi:hypothetical protein
MNATIIVHEIGHQRVFSAYSVTSHIEPRGDFAVTVPDTTTDHLTIEQWLVISVAGACMEHLADPSRKDLHTGLFGDSAQICQRLGVVENKATAYGIALALIVEGSNARLCIPQEHQTLLRQAVKTARQILGA